MSPTHANKRGVRYRYYVSNALLAKQKTGAGVNGGLNLTRGLPVSAV